jgi:hypothetical protein
MQKKSCESIPFLFRADLKGLSSEMWGGKKNNRYTFIWEWAAWVFFQNPSDQKKIIFFKNFRELHNKIGIENKLALYKKNLLAVCQFHVFS